MLILFNCDRRFFFIVLIVLNFSNCLYFMKKKDATEINSETMKPIINSTGQNKQVIDCNEI